MNCLALTSVYLRASGNVPCYCDSGINVPMGDVHSDSLPSILGNSRFAHVRSELGKGGLPWKRTCEECSLLRRGEPLSDGLAARRIQTLQVEPSLACNLRCPCCPNGEMMSRNKGSALLDPAAFEKALVDLSDAGYRIGEIEYCGHGEPTLHPKFRTFVATARRVFPGTLQRLITNGTRDYAKATGGEPLDEIVVSCDGFFQENYEKYRIGGNVRAPLAFLRDAPAMVAGRRQRRTWKYILFDWNDSDEEILAAQQAAREMEIDLLFFVVTHSMFRSQRYTAQTIGSLPITHDKVTATRTPHLENDWGATHALDAHATNDDGAPAGFMYVIDAARVRAGQSLRVTGWALNRPRVASIAIEMDGVTLGAARLGVWRPDVFRVHPRYGTRDAGFEFEGEAPVAIGRHSLALRFVMEDGSIERRELDVRVEGSYGRIPIVPASQ
jgi:hypothetical protein